MAKVKWGDLPTSLPGGALMPHMSARRRQEVVDAVFYESGDFQRLVAFTNASDENYQFFLQHLWGKGLPKVSSAEVNVSSEGIEDLISKLDAGENAKLIEHDPDE